jgi:hypothetical protein
MVAVLLQSRASISAMRDSIFEQYSLSSCLNSAAATVQCLRQPLMCMQVSAAITCAAWQLLISSTDY